MNREELWIIRPTTASTVFICRALRPLSALHVLIDPPDLFQGKDTIEVPYKLSLAGASAQ